MSYSYAQCQGDRYTFCKGSWSDIQDEKKFLACSVKNMTGCSCSQDFRGHDQTCNGFLKGYQCQSPAEANYLCVNYTNAMILYVVKTGSNMRFIVNWINNKCPTQP